MGKNPDSQDGPHPSASQPIPTLERVKSVSASASQPLPTLERMPAVSPSASQPIRTLERVAPVSPSASQPIPTLDRIAPVPDPATSLTSFDDFEAPAWPAPANVSASSQSQFSIPPVDEAELSLVSREVEPVADPFAPVADGSAGAVMSDFLLHEPEVPPPPQAPPLQATSDDSPVEFTLHSEARVADKPKSGGPDLSSVTVYGTPKKVQNKRAEAIARRRAFVGAMLRIVLFFVLFEVVVFTFGPSLPGALGDFFADLKISHSHSLGL